MQTRHIQLKAFFYLLILWAIVRPLSVYADDEFVVKSTSTQLLDNVYFLNVVYEINLPKYITTAFEQGFEIPLSMEVEIFHRKRFWLDKEIVYIKQQYRLNYHPMLDAVTVFDVNSGRRFSYASLADALSGLSVVLAYPLLDNNNLDKQNRYRARLRFGIDRVELPLPLKSSSLWKNNWGLVSDWHYWDVKP